VAGEAQDMAGVVHEFMHIRAVEQGCRPLLKANEIDAKQEQQAGEDRPGQNIAERDRNRLDTRMHYCGHSGKLLRFRVQYGIARRKRGLTFTRLRGTERSQWRDRAGFEPSSAAHDVTLNDRR